jgi:hypothetical protein
MSGTRLWVVVAGAVVVVVAAGAIYATAHDGGPSGPSVPRPQGAGGLAKKYQPILNVSPGDGFWPVSVLTVPELRFGGRGTCIHEGMGCRSLDRITDLPWLGGTKDWIEYPGPVMRPKQQRLSLLDALDDDNPYNSSQEYFIQTGGGPGQTTSLQYWLYYTDDYQPVRHVHAKAGFHEGDFESLGVLLSRDTQRPVYLWAARHNAEGQRFTWNEPALVLQDTHPVVWAARGSHATYESCGRKRRPRLGVFIDDLVDCPSPRLRPLRFDPSHTPLVDLAGSPWACWRGYFGHAYLEPLTDRLRELKGKYIIADAPISPLWQQGFDPAHARPCRGAPVPESRSGDEGKALPDATAERLRARAGRYDPLFSRCEQWFQRPTEGAYLTACDQLELNNFFRSGLEDSGSSGLRIEGSRPPPGPTVPAVYRSSRVTDVERATITTDEYVRPTVYAAAFRGSKALALRFPRVAIRPGERLRLVLGSKWRLVDQDGRRVTKPATPRVIGNLDSPPAPTRISASSSPGGDISVTFSGSPDPNVTYVVYLAESAEAMEQGASYATPAEAKDHGTYVASFARPGRLVQVIAQSFGRVAVSAPVKVPTQ